MWAKLGQLVLVYVIKPLVEDGIIALVKFLKQKAAERKKKKANQTKLENYENSSTENSTDTFNDMP